MKLLLLLLISIKVLFAVSQDELNNFYKQNSLQNTILDNDQKRRFEKEEQKSKDKSEYYKRKKIEIEEEKDNQNCIIIKNIIIDETDILDSDNLYELKKDYLNKCNSIEKLNNLTKEISNLYIKKGYVTSRAYLKLQDLSKGEVKISLLEGKIKKIVNDDIYISNIFDNLEEKILNLKDLEIGITQLERLRSQKINLKLKPSEEIGFTDVIMLKKTSQKSYYGYGSLNNYGNDQTGLYQTNVFLNYENLLDINDIISISINTTNTAFKKTDKTLGTYISYAVPYMRHYFKASYSTFNYKQTIYDQFGSPLESRGFSDTFTLSDEYIFYNSKKNTLNLVSKLSRKNNENYLSDILIELQSYKLTTFNIGFDYTHYGSSSYLNTVFLFHKSLTGKINFNKYTIDLSYTKYFSYDLQPKFNLLLHAQHTKYDVYGTEQIGIGGPYSVRGFKDGGLNGFIGAYIRNDFSISKNILNISFSPYIGLDYGYVEDTVQTNGGNIVGSSLGVRTRYLTHAFEVHFNKALYHTAQTKQTANNFTGLTYSYSF